MAGGLFILPGIVSIMALSMIYAAYGNAWFAEAQRRWPHRDERGSGGHEAAGGFGRERRRKNFHEPWQRTIIPARS